MTGSAAGAALGEERFAAAWQANYAHLVNVAFRMLGDVGHAEDIVQEAFSRLAMTAAGQVDDDRGWLTVVTSRLCLDHIRSARVRRERSHDMSDYEPLGAGSRQPAMNPADRITLDDDVRSALSVVLDRLSPAERVAFVLHDVFQVPFDAVAQTLGKPAASCRQLARRARQKIAAVPLHAGQVAGAEHQLVTEKFITACSNGDIAALLAVLDPQVWGVADFGAGSPIPRQIVHGANLVAENIISYHGHGATLVCLPWPGGATVLGYLNRLPYAVLTLTIHHELVRKIEVTVARPRSPVRRQVNADRDPQRVAAVSDSAGGAELSTRRPHRRPWAGTRPPAPQGCRNLRRPS
ncbi:MAG: RNA polymerase sigma factor SigI [Actinomycetota bacterium]|nr:RNA polymerase sigma factor SigI [Actinomycetota bacterium]